MNEKITAEIIGTDTIEIEKGTSLSELSKKYSNLCKYPILIAKVNNELYELHRKLIHDSKIEFLDITSIDGFRVYQRTTAFIMICAAKEVVGKDAKIVIEHSMNKNYYCELINDKVKITDELLDKIEHRMNEIIKKNTPIEKLSLPLEEGINLCREIGAYDKEQMLKYRRTSHVNFYKLDWFYDYFYGHLAINAGCIDIFALSKESEGFLLRFPTMSDPTKIQEKKELSKITSIFRESNKWAKILKVSTVGALNDTICHGGISSFILTNEALHEKRIASISDMIHNHGKKIILIAGPSSSGKTTFAERLSISLRVNGLTTYTISLDNYFVDRALTPVDEFGKPNFEDLHAIDVKQINEDLNLLIKGKVVEIPSFNFLTGKREYKGNYLKIGSDSVLLIEGIHALNEKISETVEKNSKFKVFISALTQLNIDDHNRIPTTDTRLIRRIVRDSRFRGFDAVKTLSMWPSVGRGEEKYIFPFQEEADAMFNSALVYEMCVLKQFAEPLLFGVDKSLPEYSEAKRLVKFLDSFIGISSEEVPKTSILREFIGGSCFRT